MYTLVLNKVKHVFCLSKVGLKLGLSVPRHVTDEKNALLVY